MGWQMADSVEYARRLKAIGIDLTCTSSGGLKGSATNARVKRFYGYQLPYAAQIRREVDIATIAVGLILDPHHAEQILQDGDADIIAIGRAALVNPNWPLHAEAALGRPMLEALDDWPKPYGCWQKFRERTLESLRADEGRYSAPSVRHECRRPSYFTCTWLSPEILLIPSFLPAQRPLNPIQNKCQSLSHMTSAQILSYPQTLRNSKAASLLAMVL